MLSPSPVTDTADAAQAHTETETSTRSFGLEFWLPVLVAALLPVALLRISLRPISDPDTFWHILAGGYLWDTWRFSGPEPWSQFSSHNWLLHEWLPELATAGASTVGGLPAVSVLFAAAVTTLVVVLYAVCRRRASPLAAALTVVVAVVGVSASLSPRPQLVSFILLGVTVSAWLGTADDHRPRWWLIPLTWLWACCHGMWFTGVVAGGVVVLGLLLDRAVSLRAAGRLMLVPLLCMAAAALTPVGPRLLLAPLHVSGYTRFVVEWDPPSLRTPYMAATVALIGLIVAAWSRRTSRVPWSHVGLLLVAFGWTLLYARTVALGAVMLAPLASQYLQDLLTAPRQGAVGRERSLVAAGAAASLALAILLAPGLASERSERLPSGFSHRLAALPSGTVVFNEYHLGGWLMWEHPELVPVIDPRTEVFAFSYVEQYANARTAGPGWEETVAHSGASAALLSKDSPLGAALARDLRWTVAGTDAGFTLWLAPTT